MLCLLKIPAAVLKNLQTTKYNWAYQGEPEPELGGRTITHDRGKTLGGSSSINGLCFIRGHALDFEGWRQSGCEGWGYADVLPYFKRLENYSGGASEYRGGNGPLAVHRPKPQNPLYRHFSTLVVKQAIQSPMISAGIAKKVLVFLI